MSYKRFTIFSGVEITDEMIEVMKTKYMPIIRTMGCLDAEIIQTGPDSRIIVVTYADKAAADAAKEKAAALGAESREEFKGNAPIIHEGEVIVTMAQPNNKVGTGGVDDGPTMPSGVVG